MLHHLPGQLDVPSQTLAHEPSGNTLTHPTTLGNHYHQPPVVDMEIELDYSDINSRKCTILIALSVLIGFGIIMTLLAVIFAMLMMFGVIQLTCRSTLQSGTSNCSCSGMYAIVVCVVLKEKGYTQHLQYHLFQVSCESSFLLRQVIVL